MTIRCCYNCKNYTEECLKKNCDKCDKYEKKGGESMTDTEKKDFEELKKRVEMLENQIKILHAECKKLSGFNSLNQKYR